jgi:hypothetical protein
MLYTKFWYFGRISGDRVSVEHRQAVIPTRFPVVVVVLVGRLATVTILCNVEFGVAIGISIVVSVNVSALSELRQRNGDASDRIGFLVDFCRFTEVKDESGD